jgi:hypothetical protein
MAHHALPFNALQAATPETAVFFPLGHPTPYASVDCDFVFFLNINTFQTEVCFGDT